MNENRKKVYGYSYLFVVTLLFSALASLIFLLYLHVRESFWMWEAYIVGTASCVLFSVLGQRLSKINDIGRYILTISAFSSILNFQIFISASIITNAWEYVLNIFSWATIVFLFGGFAIWEFLNLSWRHLYQRKTSRKVLITVIGGIVFSLLGSFVSINYSVIVSFFDSHPWVMTMIALLFSLATFIVGVFYGRKKTT